MIAVVAGMIGTFPIGGVAWDYAQYALGLEQLGFEVHYVEDTGCPALDPEVGLYVDDPSYSVGFLDKALDELSPSLGKRWSMRAADGSCHGPDGDRMTELIGDADLFLNLSGGCMMRSEYRANRRKVLVDTDPGWNHFVVFPHTEARAAATGAGSFRDHDYFFTYATGIGSARCRLPTFGLEWHPTWPPVVLDRWSPQSPGEPWTTVMSWDNYRQPLVYEGEEYGSKEQELRAVIDLPTRVAVPLEIAMGGVHPPIDELRAAGWRLRDPREISTTPHEYRAYIAGSRGEFSVAKHVYVATRSGWFSCRSVCYLAAGRPVVVQDTGFSSLLPSHGGLLSFSSLEEAVTSIEAVERDYAHHQEAAREVAAQHFASDVVLAGVLERLGLG